MASYVIEQYNIEKTLLNVDVSINLLPYTIYKQLGLGEL